jgi:hypothetical protein
MDHQRVPADELLKFVQDCGKWRLASEEFSGQAVDGESILGHVALRIDVSVKTPPGGDMVDQFDAGDLDNPMSIAWIETRRFGI